VSAVYLIGGGWTPRGLRATLGPFVRAAGGAGARIVCVLLRGVGQRVAFPAYAAALRAAGAAAVTPVFVSPARPLRAAALVGATGILVGGGATPAYHRALCPTAAEWLPPLQAHGIPYAGYSAGAMIAAEVALLGGWKAPTPTGERRLVARAFGEGLSYLTCRPGLGLVPFLVDVHAAQWGTTARLRQAVATGWADEGWAIDEGTLVEVRDATATVHGLGRARRARLLAGVVTVETLGAGAVRRLAARERPGER